MVDEVFELLAKEGIKDDEGKERDALHARCSNLIAQLTRLARACGIFVVLCTQRPDVTSGLNGATKNNLDARIACGRMDNTPSMMVLDSERATSLPKIRGRSLLRVPGQFYEYQTYFCPEEKFDSIIEQGAQAYNANNVFTTAPTQPQELFGETPTTQPIHPLPDNISPWGDADDTPPWDTTSHDTDTDYDYDDPDTHEPHPTPTNSLFT